MDFRYAGERLREYTVLPDTPANRKRLQKALDRIETEIALGSFDYAKTFGKALPSVKSEDAEEIPQVGVTTSNRIHGTPLFRVFAEQWFTEVEVTWRRSYRVTQKGALDKYLFPFFEHKDLIP